MIKIGDQSLNTRKPADLDAVLIESTGCVAAEIADQLRVGYPSHVARALHPFLAEPMALDDLASLIARNDVNDARQKVLGLYQASDAVPVETPPTKAKPE